MEKELIALSNNSNRDQLVEKLNELDNEKIIQMIDRRVSKGRDPSALVRAVFLGSQERTAESRNRSEYLFKHCVELLRVCDITSKQAIELLGLLMLEVDNMRGIFLAEVAEIYIDSIKTKAGTNSKYLDLLPKVLSSLSEKESINFRGGDMKGPECKNHIINSLCSSRWESGSILALIAMFRDVEMTTDELKFVMEKVIRMFPEVSLDELPPLIFQLLLLANKGHKDLLLEGVIHHFTELHKNQPQEEDVQECSEEMYSELPNDVRRNLEMVLQTEGTVILHVTFSAGQDRTLAREFIKYIKACGNDVFSPFTFSLAMSISKLDHCEEQIFKCLKKCILKALKDDMKQTNSWWIREMVKERMDVTETILKAVNQSQCVWDYVVQGLVKLGFHLMTAFGPRSAFGRVTEKRTAPNNRTPTQQACDLGAKILLETFKTHSMSRDEILEQLLRKIMITQEGGSATQYLDLLTNTIKSSPHNFLDSIHKLREMLDTIPCLPLPAAEGVIRALPPLLKISRSLKDALLIVLRKSLFSRQLDTRKVAVCGYIVLLRHFRIQGLSYSQLSQASIDIDKPGGSTHSASNEGLCLEILNTLRRSLSQHVQVRQTLYEGLPDVLARNTLLLEPVLEFLTSHLHRYYDDDEDAIPPLKLNSCVVQGDQVSVSEPLAVFLQTIQLCLQKYADQDDERPHVIVELDKIFNSLSRRMVKAEMEDFELDKSADYNRETGVGMRNSLLALLVIGVYEVLIEHNIMMTQTHETDDIETIAKLFDQYKALNDVVREKANGGAAGAGKRGRPVQTSGIKNSNSLLSLRCLQTVLQYLHGNDLDVTDIDDVWSTLRQDDDFRRYVMTSLVQKLHALHESGEPTDRKDAEVVLVQISMIAKYALKELTSMLTSAEQGRKHKLVSLYMEVLAHCITYITVYIPKDLDEFIRVVVEEKATDTKQARVLNLIKKLQTLMNAILSTDDKNLRDCMLLVQMVEKLSCDDTTKSRDSADDNYKEVQSWVERICEKENIEDVNVGKALMNLLLLLTSRIKNCMPVVREICQDIHSIYGDIDQEVSMEESGNYSVVNSKTSNSILMLTFARIDSELDDVEWVLAKMKTEINAQGQEIGDSQDTEREGRERSVCVRLGHMINSFHELVQTSLPLGQLCDTLLKQLYKLYTTLTNFTKYYVQLYTKGHGVLVAKYEKLVKLTGKQLTQQVYLMITYMQNCQKELIQNAEQKKKGDKKKVEAVGKAQVFKEGRAIPSLIYAIEEYEKFLIQLSKKSKMNLMEHVKHSTNRDFRINAATVHQVMDQDETDDDDDQEEENENQENENENQENQEPENENVAESQDEEPPEKKPKLTQHRRLGGKKSEV